MKPRGLRPSCVLPAVTALLLAGCGGGTSDEATVGSHSNGETATAPQVAPPTATGPPAATAPSASTPGSTTQSGGGEEPIRVPVTLAFRRGGGVDPPTVTVPAFVAVEVTLDSGDGRAHVLRLRDRRSAYRLSVGAGKRRTTRLPGLRAGSYRLQAIAGGPGATLVVGGEAGP